MSRSIALLLAFAGWAGAAPGPAAGTARVLDVEPAAAPVPVLRYQLLPELSEMQPGNAIPAYLKCFGEQHGFFFTKEQSDERERVLKMPLADIKPGAFPSYEGKSMRLADLAARHEYADWNLLPQMREEGFYLLLPDLQQLRTLATALHVRGRIQLAAKDYPGALTTIKTIFALGRHLGDHPTLIAGLVGVAITHIGLNLVEELVQQPGAPNLYWALTTLPNPLVDIRKGVSGERMMQDVGLGRLSDPTRVWGPEDFPVAAQKAKELLSMNEVDAADRDNAIPWLKDRLKDEEWLAAARKALVAAGYPPEKVARYPAEQVFAAKLTNAARALRDEVLKWMPVPYWQAADGLSELGAVKPADLEGRLVSLFGVPVAKIKISQTRVEQRIALLRAAEALRLDFAKTGKLPAKLSDLSVPVSVDPATGGAFEYKPDGTTATLTAKEVGPSPPSFAKYEVRLRGK